MFSNPLLLSRRRCSRRLRLRLLPGCRCRILCLLAGFRCRRLHLRLLQGCCLRLRLSDHLRLLPGLRLRRLHRFRPLPCSRCRRLHRRLLPGCCLRFRLHDHLHLFPGFCLRRLHPLPGCRCRLHPRPLPSCRRRCLRLLSGYLSCYATACVSCKLGNVQTFGLFVLAVKSRRERFAGPSRNRSGLATTDNSAAARKSLS